MQSIDRRTFLRTSASLIAAGTLPTGHSIQAEQQQRHAETVAGSQPASELGITLPHEHIMVDFIGADQVSRDRYNSGEVIEVVRPQLEKLREAGCKTLVECTPAYLGRDPALLQQLARLAGIQILTNTGYYGAANGKYLPPHAHSESVDQLAARWIAESRDGIDETGIRPGFIKIGVDGGPLSDVNRKLVQAAARTHRATGLTIAAHTGDGTAALQQLRILDAEGVKPTAWIWVHAQVEKDAQIHQQVAAAGGWVEFDGITPESIDQHVELLQNMQKHSLLNRVLISQDAGWYWVGESGGGNFRPYDTLFTLFLPALRKAGFTEDQLQQLTVVNPAQAFTIDKD